MSDNGSLESLQYLLVLNSVKRKPLRDLFLEKWEVSVFFLQPLGRAVKNMEAESRFSCLGEKNETEQNFTKNDN